VQKLVCRQNLVHFFKIRHERNNSSPAPV
jgi:hypothetical protein